MLKRKEQKFVYLDKAGKFHRNLQLLTLEEFRFGKARLPFQAVKGVIAFTEKISNSHPTPGNIGFRGFFYALIPQGQNSRSYRTGLFA